MHCLRAIAVLFALTGTMIIGCGDAPDPGAQPVTATLRFSGPSLICNNPPNECCEFNPAHIKFFDIEVYGADGNPWKTPQQKLGSDLDNNNEVKIDVPPEGYFSLGISITMDDEFGCCPSGQRLVFTWADKPVERVTSFTVLPKRWKCTP